MSVILYGVSSASIFYDILWRLVSMVGYTEKLDVLKACLILILKW